MRGERPLTREGLEALLIAVVFAAFARTFVVQAFKIPSASMEQNLLVGDHILVNKFIYGPTATPVERWLLPGRGVARGEVVVFRYPEDPTQDFIKRCVGLPGDEVRIVDKQLFLNGEPVEEDSYIHHEDPGVYPSSRFLSPAHRYRDNFGPAIVPPEGLFCLGDNRDNSNDSRAWGAVPVPHVKGRALLIYWSFEPPAEAGPPSGVRHRLQRLPRVVRRSFSGARWDRLFRVVR